MRKSSNLEGRRMAACDQLTDTDRMELLAAANDNEIQAMLAHGIIIEDVQPSINAPVWRFGAS